MREPEDFLREVADGLPFDEAERTEILEELRAHVADSVAALEAEGRSPDDASRTALERLGPPERLAKALTDARRNRRRLLAAAGAGSWAVFTGGIYGWCVGVLLAWLAWAATGLAFKVAGPLGTWAFEGTLAGTFDTLSFIGMGAAAYVAASAITHVVAARAGYPAESVRRVIAPVGALLLGMYALVGWSGEVNAVGVIALLTLPVWWVLGTMRTSRVLRGANRTFAAIFLVAVVAIVLSLFAQLLLSDTPRGTGVDPAHPGELDLSRIAAPVPATVADVVTGYGRDLDPCERGHHSGEIRRRRLRRHPSDRLDSIFGWRHGGRRIQESGRRRRSARRRSGHSQSARRSGVRPASCRTTG